MNKCGINFGNKNIIYIYENLEDGVSKMINENRRVCFEAGELLSGKKLSEPLNPCTWSLLETIERAV